MSHTTVRGRVVYARRIHWMDLPDVTRILKKSRGSFSQYTLEEIVAFYTVAIPKIIDTMPIASKLMVDAPLEIAAVQLSKLFFDLLKSIGPILVRNWKAGWVSIIKLLDPASYGGD